MTPFTIIEQSWPVRALKLALYIGIPLATLLSGTWFFIQPKAEEFVKQTVEDEVNRLKAELQSNRQITNETRNEVLRLQSDQRLTNEQLKLVIQLLQRQPQ